MPRISEHTVEYVTVDSQYVTLKKYSQVFLFFCFFVMFYSSFCATYSNIVIVLIIN